VSDVRVKRIRPGARVVTGQPDSRRAAGIKAVSRHGMVPHARDMRPYGIPGPSHPKVELVVPHSGCSVGAAVGPTRGSERQVIVGAEADVDIPVQVHLIADRVSFGWDPAIGTILDPH